MHTTIRSAQFDFCTDADDLAIPQDSLGGAALVSARRKHRRARKLARRAKRAAHRPAPKTRMLFVYGTSLEGEPNHHYLRQASFLREARTPPTFQLYQVGAGSALVRGGRQAIQGELYELAAYAFGPLDFFDRHLQRTVIALDDGTQADAYLLAPEKAAGYRRLILDDWRTYAGRPQKDDEG